MLIFTGGINLIMGSNCDVICTRGLIHRIFVSKSSIIVILDPLWSTLMQLVARRGHLMTLLSDRILERNSNPVFLTDFFFFLLLLD